jgi:hypothetical protein
VRTILQISVDEVVPSPGDILEAQGIPRVRQTDERTAMLAQEAIRVFREFVKPSGILMEVTKEEFAFVFHGEGCNESESPVEPIYAESRHRALFAVTVGETLCNEISRRFDARDFALGSMLDAAASEGTEMTADVVEHFHRKHLKSIGQYSSSDGTLRFSPGYCGWHISGQKKLFDALRPGEIGITLNESCLMQPLKSITGIVIFGDKNIFNFDDTFSFCGQCAEHSCRERIQALMQQ